MKLRLKVLCIVAVIIFGRSGFSAPSQDVREAVESNNSFSVGLFLQLTNQSGNLVLSPFSVSIGLATAYAGAHGQTAQQVANVLPCLGQNPELRSEGSLLRLLNESTLGNKMEIGSSLWVQNGIPLKQSFEQVLSTQLRTEINTVDLTGWPGSFDPEKAAIARERMDNWVAMQTHKKILNILPLDIPDPATRMILLNTVYFKGNWETRFDKSLTKNLPFYLTAKRSINVSFMRMVARFLYSSNAEVEMLEIPYTSNRLSMVILLPTKPDGLGELESNLTTRLVDNLHESTALRQVALYLPKFNTASQVDLRRPLQNMGIRDAFEDTADFSNISPIKPLFIETFLHKACITVDENGTTAAASTMVHFTNGSFESFYVGRPFIFLIRDNSTSTILFIGRITNPLQED